ncbi:PH domain-containing protein [Rubrivivax sp. A210]|uniref:PH domain-containing protein n=1 Tax=Rubrivivax sp. A210 TaxID=2772301 RepID=UPI0019184AF8|nr:PH domain-containing protein [Rubrivivax sp. A210]CAD5372893.1 PH domain-containing protein [Rubrivivax sp. A210]
MSSYVEGALVKDERLVHVGHISLWSLWHLIGLGLLLLPVFGLGLVFLAVAHVRFKSTELAVTTRRVIVKHGFIRRQTVEVNLSKVESIQVDQGILGRMFDHGTLVISGTGTSHAPLAGIAAPMAFRRAFIEAQDSAKSGV